MRNFCLLYYPGMRECYTLLSNFRSIIYQVVVYGSGRLKTKESFNFLAPKVVAVTYERWLLTRGYKYNDLTRKLLVFWKTGRWGKVVATGDSTVFSTMYIIWINLTRWSASEWGQEPPEGWRTPHIPQHPSAVNRRDSRANQKWAAGKRCLWFYSARLWWSKMPITDSERYRPHSISVNFLVPRTPNSFIHRNVWWKIFDSW